MVFTTSSTNTLVSPAEHSLTATGLSGSLFRIATNVFAYVLQRFFVARLNPHGRACSTALSESLLVSYRPLALELSSSRARRNPLVLCLAGIREIRGLPGYAKYSRLFWKTRSRCRRAWRQRAGPYDVRDSAPALTTCAKLWRDEEARSRIPRAAFRVVCAWDRLLGVDFGPRSTIMGGYHHRIDTFACAEKPTSRRGLMDSILNAATRGIISRGSEVFVTIAAGLATAPL